MNQVLPKCHCLRNLFSGLSFQFAGEGREGGDHGSSSDRDTAGFSFGLTAGGGGGGGGGGSSLEEADTPALLRKPPPGRFACEDRGGDAGGWVGGWMNARGACCGQSA
jgi:hypothetical protein